MPYLAKNQHFKGACRKCFNVVVDERNKTTLLITRLEFSLLNFSFDIKNALEKIPVRTFQFAIKSA